MTDHKKYNEKELEFISLLIIMQAKKDAEKGDKQAGEWLIYTGCTWLEALEIEGDQVDNLRNSMINTFFPSLSII